MYRVVALSWFQLTRLIVDHAVTSLVIVLYQSASDCETGRVTHDVEWAILVGHCQDRRLSQALLDCIKGLLTISSPNPCSVLL
ncbi:hypothetical protein PF010_g21346 [Phytophthora fragariae]|uniref:Secreted protein n=1 Tax=Phytophthora fragariae TaxID=53985 RepID=A0A6G0KCB2_9STRA|nr:hypothetical protein PF010_g21346 [Phytophthora fragariae]